MFLLPFLDGVFSYVDDLTSDLDYDAELPGKVLYSSDNRYTELELKVLTEALRLHNINAFLEDTPKGTLARIDLNMDKFIEALEVDMSSQQGIGVFNKIVLIKYLDALEQGDIDSEFDIQLGDKGAVINLMSLQMFFNSLGIETEIKNGQYYPIPTVTFRIKGSSVTNLDVESYDVFLQLLFHKLSNFIENSKSSEFYKKRILLNQIDDLSQSFTKSNPITIDLSSFSKSYRGDIVRKVLSYDNLTASFNEEFMIVDKN